MFSKLVIEEKPAMNKKEHQAVDEQQHWPLHLSLLIQPQLRLKQTVVADALKAQTRCVRLRKQNEKFWKEMTAGHKFHIPENNACTKLENAFGD